ARGAGARRGRERLRDRPGPVRRGLRGRLRGHDAARPRRVQAGGCDRVPSRYVSRRDHPRRRGGSTLADGGGGKRRSPSHGHAYLTHMRAILTYHSIDESGSPISVSREAFRAHVRWLASGAVKVRPLAELVDARDGGDAVAITFDD